MVKEIPLKKHFKLFIPGVVLGGTGAGFLLSSILILSVNAMLAAMFPGQVGDAITYLPEAVFAILRTVFFIIGISLIIPGTILLLLALKSYNVYKKSEEAYIQ